MRGIATALPIALLSVPALAHANPLTFGAALGLTQSDTDADAGLDATQTLGLWGRLGLSSRVSGQLEVTRFKAESGCDTCTFGTKTSIRTGTALLVVDLTDHQTWVPTMSAGIGLDRDDGSFPTTGHHIEGGFGLEYRGEGGVTLGADLRLGGRSIDPQDVLVGTAGTGIIEFVPARTLQAGGYKSLRVVLGVRF